MIYSWKKDLFDSTILDFPVAKIENITSSVEENNVIALISDLKKHNIRYASCRIHANNFLLIHQLERAGFILVDGLIDLNKEIKSTDSFSSAQHIRRAEDIDIPLLKNLASTVFYLNRLYNDPYIKRESANLFYATWIENSVKKVVADQVFIWEEHDKLVGFITLKNNGNIPLLGVGESYRGKGISRKLLSHALLELQKMGSKQAMIETQIGNVPAIRSYQSCGFKILDTHLTFSWHSDE